MLKKQNSSLWLVAIRTLRTVRIQLFVLIEISNSELYAECSHRKLMISCSMLHWLVFLRILVGLFGPSRLNCVDLFHQRVKTKMFSVWEGSGRS